MLGADRRQLWWRWTDWGVKPLTELMVKMVAEETPVIVRHIGEHLPNIAELRVFQEKPKHKDFVCFWGVVRDELEDRRMGIEPPPLLKEFRVKEDGSIEIIETV